MDAAREEIAGRAMGAEAALRRLLASADMSESDYNVLTGLADAVYQHRTRTTPLVMTRTRTVAQVRKTAP